MASLGGGMDEERVREMELVKGWQNLGEAAEWVVRARAEWARNEREGIEFPSKNYKLT
jgi:hypothetical protein